MRRLVIAVFLAAVAVPASAQTSSTDFTWSGAVARGKTIAIVGVNGEIRAELATGSDVEVHAVKRARRGDPSTVRIETVQEDGNVTICAVYPVSSSRWRSRERDREGNDSRPTVCRGWDAGDVDSRDNDVAVDFVVRVPAGVVFSGRTVNGRIDARGLKSDAHVRTVNGRIELSTTGIGSARTVNGSIDASVGSAAWTGTLAFKTVNGSIDLRLPKDANASLHARTMNGRFESEFPVTVHSFGPRNRRVEGVIGSGGRDLDLSTLNGGIFLRFVTP